MRDDVLQDTLASAFCQHFCTNHCRANESNDQCWCTEAAIVAAEEVRRLAPPPCPRPIIRGHLRLVVCR